MYICANRGQVVPESTQPESPCPLESWIVLAQFLGVSSFSLFLWVVSSVSCFGHGFFWPVGVTLFLYPNCLGQYSPHYLYTR